MELFTDNGHLTDEALLALIHSQESDDLTRLEIAEHLSYCDRCLQRHTELLAGQPLLVPAVSCQAVLWQRIRQRAIRIFTSRYAAAAAAVVLALTVLWSDAALSTVIPPPPQESSALTEQWSRSLDALLERVQTTFDHLDQLTERDQGGFFS